MGIFNECSRSSKPIIAALVLVILVMATYQQTHEVKNIGSKDIELRKDAKCSQSRPPIYYNGQKIAGDNPGNKVNVNSHLTRKTKLPPLDKYWAKMLHFIPEEESQNCLNLFTTESSRAIAITPEWEKIRAASNLSNFRGGFAPQHVRQTQTYQELARQTFVHTVCEIGFNVGQSAITWLTTKPDLKVYSFDIGGDGPKKMGKALTKLFPGRFTLTIGDSTKTVPRWVEQGIKCDIVFIDGGHSYPIVHADILNMQKAASKEHIMVLDDIYYPGVNKAWKEMLNKGAIHHLFDCSINGQDIDFALGYYKMNDKAQSV